MKKVCVCVYMQSKKDSSEKSVDKCKKREDKL